MIPKKTPVFNVIKSIGITCGGIATVLFIIGRTAYDIAQQYIDWLLALASLGYFLFTICFFVLAVRYLGSIGRRGSSKPQGTMGVFQKIFLYMFLPAIILTVVFTCIAITIRPDI